jgi:hypothetical protein
MCGGARLGSLASAPVRTWGDGAKGARGVKQALEIFD